MLTSEFSAVRVAAPRARKSPKKTPASPVMALATAPPRTPTTLDVNLSDDEDYGGVTIYIPLKNEPRQKSPPRSPVKVVQERPPLRRQVSFADSRPGQKLTQMKEFDTRDPPQLCNKDLTKHEYEKLKRSASVPDLSLLQRDPSKDFVQLPNATICMVREPCTERRKESAAVAVNLVNIRYDAFKRVLFGSIAVENRAYEKKVWLRYTADGWNTFNDIPAKYSWTRHGYRGPSTDYFSFQFNVDYGLLVPGIQLDFVVACAMGGETHWDNNHGENYAAEVLSSKRTEMF